MILPYYIFIHLNIINIIIQTCFGTGHEKRILLYLTYELFYDNILFIKHILSNYNQNLVTFVFVINVDLAHLFVTLMMA